MRNVTMVAGVDDQLPGVAEMKNRPGDAPDENDEDGEAKGNGFAGEFGAVRANL
jgi:hypothetical protein